MKHLLQSAFILFFIVASGAEEEIIYTLVGGTAILETPPVNQLQDYYIYWYFGEEQIAWRNRYDKKEIVQAEPWKSHLMLTYDKLTITNIQKGLYGTFTCKVKDAIGREKKTKQYRLLKFSVSLNSTFLMPRETLSVTCEAETSLGSLSSARIHWLNPAGVKVTTGGHLHQKAVSQDSGNWTCCVVTNSKKESRANVSVTVMDLRPAEPVPTRYTSKSQPLSLPCSFPAYISWDKLKDKGIQEVHWYFCSKPDTGLACKTSTLFSLSLEEKLTWKAHENRQLVPASGLSKGTLSLAKKLGGKEDRGDYICTMKFRNGVTISRKIHVEVLEIISSPGTELMYGQQINLTCSSGGPLTSDVEVKWFPPKDASLRALGSGRHPTQLTIPEVGKGDNGKWRCELWRNGTQLTSTFVMLKIDPKFSVWMLVTICGAAVIAVLLLILILIFILCRRRKRKMRHLRLRLCQCKNPQRRGFYKT